MKLSDLTSDDVVVRGAAAGARAVEIAGLCSDSRRLRPGELFAALPGGRADGRAFVRAAIEAGAAAVLADAGLAADDLPVPVAVAANPRRELALMAARFHGHRQPEGVAAVTGTNGKTSVATFARQIWTALGRPAASLGTLGVQAPAAGIDRTTGLTSPDAVMLHALLAELAGAGVERVVMEASSHGLDQHRLDGVRLQAAALTNLTRDHFDYHGGFDAYVAAKRRLFAELLPADGTAVLNADIPAFAEFERVCRARGVRVLSFGRLGDDLRLVRQEPRPDGQSITLAVHGREHAVDTRLVGAFQGSNLLAALGLVLAGGGDPEAAVGALGAVEGAPGRMQRVAAHPSGAPVFVDYAHTPDALAQVLQALRPHTAGRLVVLFGCGGDRDPGKRPEMGRIAAGLADAVFVTDDNPRSEDPAAIRRAILAACPGATEVGDRAAAIRAALAGLRAGDVLVVAGKGHEAGQIVGDRVLPFDDGAAVRAGLSELFGAAA
ncbi:MAG TPA: UDP-N-acetylmuramoyl-L-alanyl-D-glutamate--2,6-diaminopimelate ligase [Geminicoccaceae bacterium]|nr:UDP-N-acetylmuramoyl-L-alanyl-D-glutamate--2,6-diaminopimelate ligase [Geminicoccaceae bacterium]